MVTQPGREGVSLREGRKEWLGDPVDQDWGPEYVTSDMGLPKCSEGLGLNQTFLSKQIASTLQKESARLP